MVCKADTRVYTGSNKNDPTSNGFCCCSCCFCTGVLVVGVTSFFLRERADPSVYVFVPRFCVLFARCGPCLPFYSFQGEGLGYIRGKKIKWGKGEREKQKRWSQVRPSSSLSGGNSFPVAQRCSGRWSFGLSIRWYNMLWPCFVLCTYVPSRMGGTGARIRVERGLGGIVVVTLVAVEV
jgi:hypothetical protein